MSEGAGPCQEVKVAHRPVSGVDDLDADARRRDDGVKVERPQRSEDVRPWTPAASGAGSLRLSTQSRGPRVSHQVPSG